MNSNNLKLNFLFSKPQYEIFSRSVTNLLWLFSIFVHSFLNEDSNPSKDSMLSFDSILSPSLYYIGLIGLLNESKVCLTLLSFLPLFFYYPKSNLRDPSPRLNLFESF